MTEQNCLYIEVDGFAKLCDINLNKNEDLHQIYNNYSLYLNADKLENFATKIDNIDCSFILVTGNSDSENYKGNFASYEQFENFVSNDKIIHWFCQNSTTPHPKITNLPIGLAYNQQWMSNYYKDKKIDSPLEEEEILINLKNSSKPFYNRKLLCYINFVVNIYSPYKYDREEALKYIPNDLVFMEQNNQIRYNCWKNQIDYTFVISPFGNGLDCLRTWEALILGCIPIVRSSGMNPLFDDLPVLIINDWKEVTKELLETTVGNFKNRSFNYEKLKLSYWQMKINSYKQNESFESGILYNYDNIFYFVLLFLFLLFFFILKNIYLLRKVKNIIVKAIHRK
jgi:hypothetical protein